LDASLWISSHSNQCVLLKSVSLRLKFQGHHFPSLNKMCFLIWMQTACSRTVQSKQREIHPVHSGKIGVWVSWKYLVTGAKHSGFITITNKKINVSYALLKYFVIFFYWKIPILSSNHFYSIQTHNKKTTDLISLSKNTPLFILVKFAFPACL
jgi:hypothetical protein